MILSSGIYVLRATGPEGPVAAEVTVHGGERVLYLPAGDYFIQQRLPDRLREGRITLVAEQTTGLVGIPLRVLAYDQMVRKGGGTESVWTAALWSGGGR